MESSTSLSCIKECDWVGEEEGEGEGACCNNLISFDGSHDLRGFKEGFATLIVNQKDFYFF